MSIPKDDDEHQLDTVPPPPGEDDAYSAATKIGQVPDDVLQAIKRAQANEAALKKLPPENEPAAAKPAIKPEPPSTVPVLPSEGIASAEWTDDEEDRDAEAATMLRFSGSPDVLGQNLIPPRDVLPSAPEVPAPRPDAVHVAPQSIDPGFAFGAAPAAPYSNPPAAYSNPPAMYSNPPAAYSHPPANPNYGRPSVAAARPARSGYLVGVILASVLVIISAVLWIVLH